VTATGKTAALLRGGKTAVWICSAERLGNHSMAGTSLWVPARLGNRSGTREKKQKASRAQDVRSQAPKPFWTKVMTVGSGRLKSLVDQEAEGEVIGKQTRWSCYGTQIGHCKTIWGLLKPMGQPVDVRSSGE